MWSRSCPSPLTHLFSKPTMNSAQTTCFKIPLCPASILVNAELVITLHWLLSLLFLHLPVFHHPWRCSCVTLTSGLLLDPKRSKWLLLLLLLLLMKQCCCDCFDLFQYWPESVITGCLSHVNLLFQYWSLPSMQTSIQLLASHYCWSRHSHIWAASYISTIQFIKDSVQTCSTCSLRVYSNLNLVYIVYITISVSGTKT
jgi:hypothetical protein